MYKRVFYCPQAFLSLNFQRRMDVLGLKSAEETHSSFLCQRDLQMSEM